MAGRNKEGGRPALAAILLALLMAGFIVYGSLYPFRFRPLPAGVTFADAFAEAWRLSLGGRGDMAANLLLYAPLGLMLALAFARLRPAAALLLAVLPCVLLSAAMETLQLYVAGRVAGGRDFLLNSTGALLGAVAGILLAPRRTALALAWRPHPAELFPALLLACWLGYRLYPYVPALDLGEWKAALKPLLLPFAPDWLRVLRLGLLWLVAARLLASAWPRLGGVLPPLLLMAATLAAAVPLVGRILTHEELLAAAAVLVAWPLLRLLPGRWQDRLLLPALLAAALLEGLAPYVWLRAPRPYGWMPFLSLLHGQPGFGLQAALYKLFLYGGLGWLALRAGLRPLLAAAFAVLVAFGVSRAQIWLPGRSAEITDAAIAAGAMLALWLLRPGKAR